MKEETLAGILGFPEGVNFYIRDKSSGELFQSPYVIHCNMMYPAGRPTESVSHLLLARLLKGDTLEIVKQENLPTLLEALTGMQRGKLYEIRGYRNSNFLEKHHVCNLPGQNDFCGFYFLSSDGLYIEHIEYVLQKCFVTVPLVIHQLILSRSLLLYEVGEVSFDGTGSPVAGLHRGGRAGNVQEKVGSE